jgi:hypothetical protein
MQEPFTRDRIIEALRAMAPNATIDDAIERLLFLAKVETGLAELDESKGIPHAQARHRFGLLCAFYGRHNRCAILTLSTNTGW